MQIFEIAFVLFFLKLSNGEGYRKNVTINFGNFRRFTEILHTNGIPFSNSIF